VTSLIGGDICRLNESTIHRRMYSLARSRRAPSVAKAFVKPHELIYNKAAMPVPFTGQCRVISTRLVRAERIPSGIFWRAGRALGLQ
jgi:hypothetical protein